jgi:hypothetical protein
MLKSRTNPITEAVNYLYNIDFADIAELFDDVAVGDMLPSKFLPILGGVTGDHWSMAAPAPYTLAGSRVVYKGVPVATHPCCTWFEQIVVVALAPECTALHGNLVFHFRRC